MMPKTALLTAATFALIACTATPNQAAGNTTSTATPADRPANLTPSTTLPFQVATIGHFDQPFAMAFLPDGSLLVTEKAGHLERRAPDGKVSVIAGVPTVATGGQGGLLDVAPAPDFATSHRLYLSYAEPRPAGSSLALASATLAVGALHDVRVIWRAGSDGKGGQFGAVIAFAPDGRSLFVSSGERQRFTPAQDPNQALGKIVHLTLDGRPAPDNPGFGKTGSATVTVTDPPADTVAAANAPGQTIAVDGANLAPAETWSSGHRNPYGLQFDSAGRLWEVEMGPQGGDEVNLIERGRNYGWPIVSNGDNYDDVPIPDHPTRPQFAAPTLWWNPSISPGGMMIYSGNLFPAWKGNLFVAALSGEALIRVMLAGDSARAVDQWALGMRIRDVVQAPDGAIWLLEDGGKGAGGRLMRLTPKA